MRTLARLTICALLCATAAHAETIALVGGTVHTANGPVLENATVVIENGKIAAVGTNVAVPVGATVVPCQGKHVSPGFVSANTILGLTEVQSVRGTNDYTETGIQNPNVRAEVELNPDSELLPVARVNGVTSALVVPRGGLVSGTSAVVHLDGWTPADMTLKAPVGLHVQWPARPSPTMTSTARETATKAYAAQMDTLRIMFDDARAYWKARDAEGKPGIPRHDRDVKWDAMSRAIKGEIPVFFHAAPLGQIKAALEFVDEQKLSNVVIVSSGDVWRVADELARRKIAVVVAGTFDPPMRQDAPYDERFAVPGKLAKAGVRFCIADDGEADAAMLARNLPYHAAVAVAFGLSRDEALRAVTLYPAQILGVADKLGSIEPGKIADLVVADGDPLGVTTHVEQVYIQGKAISMETRHTRLFQKYDAKPRGPKARPR